MKNESIKCIPFPGIEGAYVVISGRHRSIESLKRTSFGVDLKTTMTLFFDSGNGIGAEWEPEYGPITTYYSVPEDHPKAQEHWFYPFVDGTGHWTQLAVEKHDLKLRFLEGDYEYIFGVLKEYSGKRIGVFDALMSLLNGDDDIIKTINPIMEGA